jgi:hypothetical protein
MDPGQARVLRQITSGTLNLSFAEQGTRATEYGFTPAGLRLAFELLAPLSTGTDATSSFQIERPSSPQGVQAVATLGLIDGVHACAGLPRIPLRFGAATRIWGMLVLCADGRPRHLRVSANAPFLPLTLLHEFGHLLDRCLPLPGSRKASRLTESAPGRSVLAAVHASGWWTRRRAAAVALALTDDLATYQLSDEEAFANAYAQWLVGRSGCAPLKDGFRLFQAAEQDSLDQGQGGFPLSFPESEFVPIAHAFDRLFAPLLHLSAC